MSRLTNKVALITGATGGIGLATAKLFANEGASLVLVDLNPESLDAAKKELGGAKVAVLAGDVTEPETMDAAAALAIDQFGQLDVAFLNAGIEGAIAPLTEYSLEDYDKVMAVNARGVFLGLKAVIPSMKKARSGSIIITSSLAGLRGMAKISAYVASKHAAVGLMKAASLECASANVRVNTINPAPIATRMIAALEDGFAPGSGDAIKERIEKSIPLRRYGQPDEVAQLALFLASDDASYITGNTYPVDGGMSAA